MTDPEMEALHRALKECTITATLAAATEKIALDLPASCPSAERLQTVAIAAHEKALAACRVIERLRAAG